MGVEVAQHHSIAVGMVEDCIEVWSVARSARRGRRDVDVVDADGGVTKMNSDSLDLEKLVVDVKTASIDGFEPEIVMDEDDETATPTNSRTITPDHCIVSE